MKERTPTVTTMFTEAGAKKLYVLMRDKYNCEMIQKPKYNEKTYLWEVAYHDPKLRDKE